MVNDVIGDIEGDYLMVTEDSEILKEILFTGGPREKDTSIKY